jgi:hypothetical protein
VSWNRRGRIFEPASQALWIGTHAALPVVEPIDRGHRVYFCSRDAQGRSQIGYGELEHGSTELSGISPDPVLRPGELGAFDDGGVTTACLVREGGRAFLYYTGWSLGVSVPFYLHVGLAIGESDGAFRRIGGVWRMWYVSGTGWQIVDGRPRHNYHIKYAESRDGRRWARTGAVAIDYAEGEFAFGRPCVIRDDDLGLYRMWYSVRGDTYRLGYAESGDGIVWHRLDDRAGLPLSETGWDSEMIAYPVVFQDRGTLHMLYNGNDYGRSGIGLATLS